MQGKLLRANRLRRLPTIVLCSRKFPRVLPQRAASLRVTEEGRKLLDAGEAPKAISRLERAIVIDSDQPLRLLLFGQRATRLGRYKESLNFLDVAESRLRDDVLASRSPRPAR